MTAQEYEEMIVAKMHKTMKDDNEAHKKKWGSGAPYKLNQPNGGRNGKHKSKKDTTKGSKAVIKS